MAQSADVRSIDAIADVKVALVTFQEDVQATLVAIKTECRRTLEWLTHEQQHYWKRQIRKRQDEVAQAKSELFRRQVRGAGPRSDPPDMTEYKLALRKAKRRLEEANEKLRACQRWALRVQRAFDEYRGHGQALANMLDTDLVSGLAWLDRMIESLHAYVTLAPPPTPAVAEGAGSATDATALQVPSTESMARAGDREVEDGDDDETADTA